MSAWVAMGSGWKLVHRAAAGNIQFNKIAVTSCEWGSAHMLELCKRDGAVKTECMPFTAIPHSSRLFLDFLFHYEKVERFYAHRPHLEAVVEHARKLEFPAERRARVADVLEKQNRRWGASAEALASIEKLRQGAVACISGQQVGVLGGPFY